MITKETEIKYIDGGGSFCPKCKKTDIEGGDLEPDGGYIFQNITCHDCGYQWTDEYKLAAAYDDDDGLEKEEVKNFY